MCTCAMMCVVCTSDFSRFDVIRKMQASLETAAKESRETLMQNKREKSKVLSKETLMCTLFLLV